MIYIFQDLLNIRKHSEQTAMNQMLRAKEAVHAAKEQRQKKGMELLQYINWRQKEEKRLFDELFGQYCRVDELEDFNDAIDALRNQQSELNRAIKRAADNVIEAEKELAQAKQHYFQIMRQRQKLEEHKLIWKKEQQILAEREADEEMDEFSLARSF